MEPLDEVDDAGPRRLGAVAWRIALALLPLGAGLIAATSLLSGAQDLSDPRTLTLRITAGIFLSTLTLGTLWVLVRIADRARMPAAGVTGLRAGWRLAVWGALLWSVPAAAALGVLGLLGMPLEVTVTGPELLRTVLLLLLAVLLTEALPEEAVFRGYVMHALGGVTRGWGLIAVQALLFTAFAGLLRQSWDPLDLSLFLTMGIGFGWLRQVTGSVWMSLGVHAAFQTGAQLVLTHDAVMIAADAGTAMLALGAVPFIVAAAVTAAFGVPGAGRAGAPAPRGRSSPAR